MGATEQLVLATAAFLATHFLPSTPLRPALVKAMGEWPYRGLYSIVALATLVWMVRSYAHAPVEPLWPGWRPLPLFVMPFAFVLLACGYARNPTAVGADRLLHSEEPARGMIRVTRHPLMWAVILWSLVHVLALGDLKSVIFFGGLFALAALGTVSIDSRKKANPDWPRFRAMTSNLPFLAIAQGRNRLAWREIGWAKPAIGLGLYVVFLFLHPLLFGVRPY